MVKEELPIIEFNERFDKIPAEQIRCPNCGDKYMTHVPYVNISCGKCGSKFMTDFKQDIYTKKARKILSTISFNPGFVIKASEKYEPEIIHVQKHFKEQLCYDVSELVQSYDEHRRCEKCGVCFDCFTCKNCGKTYEKNPNRRKQVCPHCQSTKYVKTYFKEVITSDKNKKIKLCPYCKSDSIIMTRSRLKSKCHICNSKKMGDKITERMFKLTIKRKRGYRKS